ncbi:NAD(P)-dependent oxidoreductase [Reyranella sp. CPCC 100927]|uniref:NAD(P)-dependent oxidoreductase n=1 Tax=Reyranella sp. CPCC 100927 TaxID=2599616 RepID=UPI0011B3A4B7|nr:NAD(P)-binding domain-containing protein [Reyranella sp. CPCC 100927]TWT05004.1 NAD(P)-dependent oxidoreductase [Reyranella sp. CPCC 100927]
MTTICVFGAGRMGSALARAFLKAGYETRVWNRTPERCRPLADLGARIAASLDEAVAASDIVVVNVLDYAAADTHLQSPAVSRALGGKLLVQLTSGSPDQARQTAAWADRHDIRYLDGAIMATPNVIGEPFATILYAGDRPTFDVNKAVFDVLGGNMVHVGDNVGHASALDIALLSALWGKLFGTLQAITVCQVEGIALDAYAHHLQPFTKIILDATDDLIARARERRYRGDDDTLASIAAHHGAFQHLMSLCSERQLNRALPDAFDGIFRAAIAAGHLHDDFAALVPFMR